MDDPTRFTEAQNQVRYTDMIDAVRDRTSTLYTLPGCGEAVKAIDTMRTEQFETWMDRNGYDLVAFPTNGDVASADADELLESALHALQDGVKYSNGGRALKHLGIPCITVPMGTMEDKQMPVGITFCTKAWNDNDLLRCAYAYEFKTRRRTLPSLTPPLPTDEIRLVPRRGYTSMDVAPLLKIESTHVQKVEDENNQVRMVSISGSVQVSDATVRLESVTAFVNGEVSDSFHIHDNSWLLEGCLSRPNRREKYPVPTKVPKDQFMIVVVAKTSNGRAAAEVAMID